MTVQRWNAKTMPQCKHCGQRFLPKSNYAGERSCGPCRNRRVCADCGTVFTGPAVGARSRCGHCSYAILHAENCECGSRVIPILDKGYHNDWRKELVATDCGICQICGEAVDESVHARHPLAPTTDHIIPKSHPLYPGDIRSNVQLAHRGCNSRKGNRVSPEEVADWYMSSEPPTCPRPAYNERAQKHINQFR